MVCIQDGHCYVQGVCRASAGACCLLVPPTCIICWWAARRVRWEQMHFRASPTRITEGVHQVSPQEILPEETLKSPARTRRTQWSPCRKDPYPQRKGLALALALAIAIKEKLRNPLPVAFRNTRTLQKKETFIIWLLFFFSSQVLQQIKLCTTGIYYLHQTPGELRSTRRDTEF